MILYPAIDLLNGAVVRLRQGDYARATIYDRDPLTVAARFKACGAEWLHIVDLNAARTGIARHAEMIAGIRKATRLKVQTGGGVRDMAQLEHLLLDGGIDRVVLGTAAVRDRDFTRQALKRYADRIAIGVDARDGQVAVAGWTESSGLSAEAFIGLVQAEGAQTIVFTDIRTDGMMSGPPLDELRRLVQVSGRKGGSAGLAIIASGGIGSEADVWAVRETGVAGLIIGRALYEGKVDLCRALKS